MNMHKILADLKRVKEAEGLSNEFLGQKIGVSTHTVSRWLNGRIAEPHTGSIRLVKQWLTEYQHAKEEGRLEDFLRRY